jgi:hypothetical protein
MEAQGFELELKGGKAKGGFAAKVNATVLWSNSALASTNDYRGTLVLNQRAPRGAVQQKMRKGSRLHTILLLTPVGSTKNDYVQIGNYYAGKKRIGNNNHTLQPSFFERDDVYIMPECKERSELLASKTIELTDGQNCCFVCVHLAKQPPAPPPLLPPNPQRESKEPVVPMKDEKSVRQRTGKGGWFNTNTWTDNWREDLKNDYATILGIKRGSQHQGCGAAGEANRGNDRDRERAGRQDQYDRDHGGRDHGGRKREGQEQPHGQQKRHCQHDSRSGSNDKYSYREKRERRGVR